MIRPRRRMVRAYTLIEMIAILPVLAILLTALAWSLSVQLKVSRGTAAQTNRQEIMHRILRSMRSDLLAADAVHVESFDADERIPDHVAKLQDMPPLSDDSRRALAATVTIRQRRNTVTYYLVADTERVARSEIASLPDAPPEYILARLDSNDEIPQRIWRLHDLQMRVLADEAAAGMTRSTGLRLEFESRQRLDARAPARRRFDTTLRAGGGQ